MAKIMMSEYNPIRNILRDTYIYGCFTKYDFAEMGVNEDTFDNHKNKIKSFLPDDFVIVKRFKRKHILYCKYNMFDNEENYIADTYRYCSPNNDDITIQFNLLSLLADGEERDLNSILSEMDMIYEDLSDQRLRRRLSELADYGYVKVLDGEKNENKYKIAEDILCEFSKKELLDIYHMLEFYSNTSVIEMPYYFAKERIKKYLKINYNEEYEISNNNVFWYKHNHMFNLIDNDVLYQVLMAIELENLLEILHGESNTKITENPVEDTNANIIPVKVIHECTYGRQYLIGYNINEQKIETYRIDKIKDIKILELEDKELLKKAREEAEKENNCWVVASINNEMRKVKVKFIFDEEKEGFILRRLQNECRGGKLEKIEKGVYIYEREVTSAVELIPWIRSFGERAVVLESGEERIEERIKSNWNSLLDKYESDKRNKILKKYNKYR